MSFFTKLSNGWNLSMASFEVLKKNKQLLVFPLLSTAALIATTVSFILIILSAFGNEFTGVIQNRSLPEYVLLFGFYMLNYFIIVFFNMGLIHCVRLYFRGEEPTIQKGLVFSVSRISDILAWAVLSATVGLLLNILQNNLGRFGKIITGLLGIVWSIATFFVVPVIAYERTGPIDAVKRSASIMKQKWGESLAANFSFGIIHLIVFAVIILPLIALAVWGYPVLAFAIGIVILFTLSLILTAAKMIFIAALYEYVNNSPVTGFDNNMLDSAFATREKKGWF